MLKKSVFFLVLSFTLFGCGSSIGLSDNGIVTTIVLTADKTAITADGVETVTLLATVKDQNNATLSGVTVDYYAGTTKLTNNIFKTTAAETYNLTAKVGTVTSNLIAVTAKNKITTTQDFEILEKSDNTYEIVKYIGTNKQVLIPEKINEKTVTSIGGWAFSANKLTNITIPNSVTSIGDYAFSGNELTSIIIPKSVTTIGTWAFRSNKLTNITIPNSVISIGYKAFADNQLTSATIPKSVTYIGPEAFAGNSNLTIHGTAGSSSETYAKNNNIKFIAE